MGTSVRPDEDELDRALAGIRAKKPEAAQPSIDDALASIRGNPEKKDQPPVRLRPVVVTKPEAPPKPMIAAQPDVTRVGPEPVGLEEQLRNEHPTLLDATVQGVKGMVEHPIDTGIALAETPFKGGQAVGEYVKGGRLNRGKGRAAAIGAAQTGAMLLGGPTEKLAEPIVARLAGEAAAPLITRTAVGAATGATFTPDRPAVGAIIGGAAGAISSRGVAEAKLAERQAQFEELARQHPDWFGESTPAGAESRASRILDNPNRPKATATIVEPPSNRTDIGRQPPSVSAEPDFTVEEPIIQQKGVFGGALEQHGKDFADGKVAPAVPEPPSPIHPKGEEAPAKPFVMPSTVEEIDDAMDANAARYSKATDPAERRHILQLQELLEDHRTAIAPPEPEHKFSSTQLDLPEESSAAVKALGADIPDNALAPDGREDKPHITVKYGLHGEDPEAVRKLLANEPPVTVKLGKTSFFPNGEPENGDVVKVDVDSPELHKLNKKIANALPHTDTHPEYKPHVTIAYVRPGLGKKYEGDTRLQGHTMTFDRLTFSDKNGEKHEVVLGGKAKAVSQKKQGNVLRSPTWDDAKKDLTLDTTAEMDEVRSAARVAGFDGLVVNGEHIDLRKPKEPVHESARVPSGGLRDNFETVKNDGLIKEMFEMLGADDPSDSIRAIYRTVEADVSGTQYGVMIQAATRKGNGPSEQAKALHRMELKKGVAGRIERILNARGLTDEQITRRYAELVELEAERTAEVEGQDNEERGDTSFEFGEEGYTNEHGEGAGRAVAEAEGAKPPAEGGAGRSAADAGPRARKGTPTSEAKPSEVAPQEPAATMDEIVAKMRASPERVKDPAIRIRDTVVRGTDHGDAYDRAVKRGLISGLDAAEVEEGFTTTKRLFVDRDEAYRIADAADQLEQIPGIEPRNDGLGTEDLKGGLWRNRDASMQRASRPERNGYDQAVHDLWKEAGQNGRLELLDQWRRLYPEQDWFPEWADREAEDLPRHVRDQIGIERVKQAVALKDLGALQRVDPNATIAQNVAAGRMLLKALANGEPITGTSQLYDTSSGASPELLKRLADKPHIRQLAQRVEKAFADVAGAIAKRFDFAPAEFGGFDVSHEILGENIKRDTWALKAKVLGLAPYSGPTSNLVLLNPYMAALQVAASARLRESEFPAALSESTFATIVHELAHQTERGHDEAFVRVHTDYAGAASAIAAQVLKDLDIGWQVALQEGIGNDVIDLQQEVWDEQQRQQHEQKQRDEGVSRGESSARNPSRLSLGRDAGASYLRSSEGDGGLGEGDGRRRLGVRPDVRGGQAGGGGEGGASPESVRRRRLGEKRPGDAAPEGAGLESELPARLPEPSGLTHPRSNIRPAEIVRALRSFLNPEALGPEARAAAGTIRHQSAEAYHRLVVSTHALDSFKAKVDKLLRLDQVKLWDDAEHGRPLGDPELDEGNRLLRQATEARTKQLVAFDRLKAEKTIENYIGRFWSKTTSGSGRDFLRAIMGRRPFEGPKSFLNARDLNWFVDGLKRPDLIPATYNYVESQLAKLAEMERVISAEHTLRQEEKLGRARRVMLGAETPLDAHGDKWVKIDPSGEDPAFVVYLPPEVPHWEAVDTMVYGKLRKLIDELSVEHVRKPRIGRAALGYAEGDQRITTKFGGAEGVVMHELGHILDARYGLGDRIDEAIGKAPKRKVMKGKRAGQEVPDYKAEGKDAAKRRQALREELRQLANLRRETLAGVPATKDLHETDRKYLHSGEEKMANMVEAYIAARDRFRRVAPGIFEIFDRIVQDHPELHTLRDIEPSMSREEHGSSTRVPGIITGGHWYAPRDAAAVWQNHLSKGLAGNPIYDAAIAPVHAGTQMLLGFSGFHGTVIATEGAFSDLALATDNLANKGGDLSAIPKQIARAAVSPIAGVTFGRKVMQEYRVPGTHPELKEVLDNMIAGGFRGRATSELWSGDRKERLKVAFREALHAQSKGRRLWGAARLPINSIWAGVEMASGPLMSKYVPLMKTAATYNAVAQALEKLPLDTSIDELHRVMGDVVKEMDFRFGQVDYDNHFINRVAKDLAQLVFLAPGWTFGTLGLAARGIRDVAKVPVRLAKRATGNDQRAEGEVPPELIGKSAAYWIGAVLGTMLINGTLTYFNTGERPHGMDYWAFRDGSKDNAGNWNRHTVPGYLMHDIYGWSHHPVHTFKNKFAPTLAFFARLAENKDYFGDMIYDPDADLPTEAKQAGKALLKEHTPLSVQNYLEGKQRGEGGATELLRNAFGVTPARRELVRTPAQNKMAEYLGRHSPETRTPDEADKGEMHRDVLKAVKAGEKLPKDVTTAIASGKLKRSTVIQWIQDARTTATVAQFKRLSVDEAKKVWALASPAEKAMWAGAYRTKLVNAKK